MTGDWLARMHTNTTLTLTTKRGLTVEKSDFHENMRYTITYRDESGKLRPAGIYVMKTHADGMVVRLTQKEGILRKIKYEDVVKIVQSQKVDDQDIYYIPAALLSEKHWQGKSEIQHYSSMPHAGK